jgi:hypothetical protein
MIRGSIFTVGTPTELGDAYGRDWRVEILLENEEREIEERVHAWVVERWPRARVEMERPKNRIYAIPADDVEIAELFREMKGAVTAGIGVRFFTCAASTLEKVFLDLVAKSEEMGVEEAPP